MKTAAFVLRVAGARRERPHCLKALRRSGARSPDEPGVERVQHRHCGAAAASAVRLASAAQAQHAPAGSSTCTRTGMPSTAPTGISELLCGASAGAPGAAGDATACAYSYCCGGVPGNGAYDCCPADGAAEDGIAA